MSQPSFVPIPPNELGGVIAIYIFALFSTLGLVSVALRITWLFMRRHLLLTAPETQICVFFNTQFGHYAACLLVAMVFSSTAGMVGISWVVQRGITEGRVCKFQATLMQIANFAIGYFTIAIAVHSFNSLVLKMRPSVILRRSVMSIGWIVAILGGLAPFIIHHPDGDLYGVDGLTCGVRSVYPKQQIYLHLLPIFVASFLSASFYSLTFLVLRGTLKLRGGIKLTLNPNERWNSLDADYDRFIARVASSMLWYPVAYTVFLVPYSIMRMLDVSGFAVPFELTVFAFVCWYSLGVVDVLLLYNTFRLLSSVTDIRPASAGIRRSMESFYTPEHLQKHEYLPPSQNWKEQISQYRNPDFPSSRLAKQDLNTEDLESNPVPLHLGRIEDRTHLSSPSDIIALPPSASLFSRADMNRRALPAPPPQSRFVKALHERPQTPLEIYDNPISRNEHVIIRQQSMETFGHKSSSRSMISSWASDEVPISQLSVYLVPKMNEGQNRPRVSTPPLPGRLPLTVSSLLSPLAPMSIQRPSRLSTTRF